MKTPERKTPELDEIIEEFERQNASEKSNVMMNQPDSKQDHVVNELIFDSEHHCK